MPLALGRFATSPTLGRRRSCSDVEADLTPCQGSPTPGSCAVTVACPAYSITPSPCVLPPLQSSRRPLRAIPVIGLASPTVSPMTPTSPTVTSTYPVLGMLLLVRTSCTLGESDKRPPDAPRASTCDLWCWPLRQGCGFLGLGMRARAQEWECSRGCFRLHRGARSPPRGPARSGHLRRARTLFGSVAARSRG